jgi:DNA-binding Xre family transcriptional regulator
MVHIGKNIEDLLISKRLRKKELIDLLAITRQGFENKLKSGHFKPNELEIVAKYFDIEVYELLSTSSLVEKKDVQTDSRIDIMFQKIFEELKLLHNQLSMKDQQINIKDQQINKLLDLMGKLDPISEPAKVMSIIANEYKTVA